MPLASITFEWIAGISYLFCLSAWKLFWSFPFMLAATAVMGIEELVYLGFDPPTYGVHTSLECCE